ncbi:hypothetical protein DPSP01_010790 [Paraphaeosphaeria sporulosa]|uniref:S-adenosyl-L-methionine-dependent methyltransferase n=1 Tax=Paraphaeosphaeria sporulosa TaxID=1460663 RepID=A0A177C2B8_9PLEO|nr:S-adenosyl-L-methionine-dependent methyltransferase [Paraphaeosphaeria sporulosa]OAG01301.1 S-adenosyl-L-methionine-dependent methyltransferase [Paraphaeosphaeria sporulosa]
MSTALHATMNESMPLYEQAERYGLLPFQHEHRVKLLRQMNIQDGDRILEIGCGQGDCTTALALLYPNSHVTAIDPAPLDYGGPETLGQAQARIKTYDIGSRIEFVQATPTAHLKNVEKGAYEVALMCHSLWYFSNRAEVISTMEALKGKTKKLLIAEWALKSHSREGDVHVQVAFTRATCEAHIPDTTENIRSPLSPSQIKQCVIDSGWVLHHDLTIPSNPQLEDAKWELNMLLGAKFGDEFAFMKRVKEHIQEERIHLVLEGMLESVKSSVDAIGGEDHIKCMDVWIGSFAQ